MHAKDDGRICLLLQFSFSHNLSSCHTHKYYTFFFFFYLESLLGNHRHIFKGGLVGLSSLVVLQDGLRLCWAEPGWLK